MPEDFPPSILFREFSHACAVVISTHGRIMILRLPKSDLRMRGGNAGRLSTEISAPVAGRLSRRYNLGT